MRLWSESNNLKWKMIIYQADLVENDKYTDEEQKACTAKSKILEDSMLISSVIGNLTTRDTSISEEQSCASSQLGYNVWLK